MVLNKNFVCNSFFNMVQGLQLDKENREATLKRSLALNSCVQFDSKIKMKHKDSNSNEPTNTLVYATELDAA